MTEDTLFYRLLTNKSFNIPHANMLLRGDLRAVHAEIYNKAAGSHSFSMRHESQRQKLRGRVGTPKICFWFIYSFVVIIFVV